MRTARFGRYTLPARLAAFWAAFLAAFTAERTKRLTNGWIEPAVTSHGCCGLYHDEVDRLES